MTQSDGTAVVELLVERRVVGQSLTVEKNHYEKSLPKNSHLK